MTRETSVQSAGAMPPASLDIERYAVAVNAIARLSEQECRSFLLSTYRAVLAFEDSGDVGYLERFAAQASTAAQLNARDDYRTAIANAPNALAVAGHSLSISEVLARLGA